MATFVRPSWPPSAITGEPVPLPRSNHDTVKRLRCEIIAGGANNQLIDSSVYVEGPLGGGTSGGLAARRSYIDTILPAFIPEQEGSATVVVTPVLLAMILGGGASWPALAFWTVLSGTDAFTLHDTYGFPIDLTLEMASEAGLTVDVARFDALMTEQRERARAARAARARRPRDARPRT